MEGWRKRREAGWERKGGRGGGTKERRGRKDSLPERPLSLVSFPYIPAVKLPSEEYNHPDFIGARGGGGLQCKEGSFGVLRARTPPDFCDLAHP